MRADEVYAILKGKIVKLTEDIKEVGDWKPIRHQGTVQTAEDLPADAKEGYMYNIATDSIYGAAGMNVVKTADGWDPMGPIVNMDLYLSKEEAKKGYQPAGDYLTENKAKKTYQPVGNYSTKEETEKKLNKNQGINNAGKITGINADGDIVPVFPTGVQYNEETNLLEFGTDPNMLNKGIQLDATLKKSGYAADSAAVGENIDSLKEDISTKITKFYASSQGETHLADSDNGKITDMVLYGQSEQKQYSGKNLFDFHQLKPKVPNITTVTTTEDAIIVSSNAQTFTGAFKIYEECDAFKGKTITISANIVKADNFDAIINFGCGLFYENAWHWKLQKVTDLGARHITVIVPETITKIQFILNTNDSNVAKANTITVSKYMVEYGSEATSYEPYVGGQPSPSPDYPQEIKSVVNPTVKVCGKNLLKATLQTTTQNGVTCTANGDGTYTLNGTATTITTFDIAQDVSCSSFRLVGCPVGGVHDASYELQARTNNLIYGYDTGDGKNIKADENFFIRIRINTGINCNNLLFKPMIVDASLYPDATYDDFEPYKEQTVTLPYTLNAIPVSSGGNVTIDGQQYVADYVDVERGKLVRMCKEYVITGSERLAMYWLGNASYLRNVCCINNFENIVLYDGINPLAMSDMFIGKISKNADDERAIYWMLRGSGDKTLAIKFLDSDGITTVDLAKQWLIEHKPKIVIVLSTPEEIDLTSEEVRTFKALVTYYPTTNISVNSEQLDGYTVFNYPISMENGWNYVKQQIGDTRNYIYDMDARAQDTDLQAAEAYVNSEYAVALTELEV